IRKGSVVDQRVEAVVCSANNWLMLGTGNAGEIREACGVILQKECDRIIEKNHDKPLRIGTSVVTGAGKLKNKGVKIVIHAIGLGYKKRVDGKLYERIPATLKTIRNAVKNTLAIADTAHIKSIAFPLMCARRGYNAVKGKKSSEVIFRSMIKEIEYFGKKKQSTLKVLMCLKEEHLQNLGYNYTHSASE
ncbi:MAG: macro domain-containing protein, partial [Patescibacteria group bacterium]